MNSKPIIGLNVEYKPSYGSVPSVCYLFSEYVDSVVAAGGIPVLIPTTDDIDLILRQSIGSTVA